MPTYLIFAGILAVNGIVVFFVIPNSLNDYPEITEFQIDAMSLKVESQINYSIFFNNIRCLFALGSCTILSFLVNFKQAFTSIILKDNFGINESIKGLIVSIPAMTQIIGAFLVGIL